MLVDASAIVGILASEPDHEDLAERLARSQQPITSPLAMFEAVLALSRDQRLGLQRALVLTARFFEQAGIELLPIDAETAELAVDAFDRFGKGRHPARLNLGDCFAYAMAKQHRVPLLYKGDDFVHTDLA